MLNLDTGLVLPQFHTSHDEFFETITDQEGKAKWRRLAGFGKARSRELEYKSVSKLEKEKGELSVADKEHSKAEDE